MLKVGIKRRRTKAQIEQDKEEVILRDLDQREKMAELEDLRKRVLEAEQQAFNNKAAATLLSNMITNGTAKQTSGGSIVVNAKDGEQEFSVDMPHHDGSQQIPLADQQ